MSATVAYDYNYVLNLAVNLAPEERKRLVREVETVSEKQEVKQKEVKWVEYTVPGEPIISPEKMQEIKRRANERPSLRTPKEIETNRRELLEILRDCPVLSDEELKGFEEARKEINECRLAYL